MREKKTGTNKKLRGGGVDAAAATAFSMCVCVCVRMMCGIKENGGCWRNRFFSQIFATTEWKIEEHKTLKQFPAESASFPSQNNYSNTVHFLDLMNMKF